MFVSFVLALVYAISDELHQEFTPGRRFELADIVYDLAGMTAALGLIWINGRRKAGQFLEAVDSFSSADVIVILGGDNSDFTRARRGVRLFHQGYAPMVVLSVGSYGNDGSRYSSAQQSLEVVQRLGLPTDATTVLFGARSTYDEAVRLRELARQDDWHSLIVVTDLYHARRAGRTFRTLLPDTTIYVSAAPNPKYEAGHWWQSKDSLVHFFSEAFKLAFYWVKHGIAPIG